MSAKDSFHCSCSDTPYSIVARRQADSWQTQGFWCSSTLTMMNFDGTTKYVWNPYSLAELESILGARGSSGNSRLQDYMDCIATGGTCTPPSNPVFDRQQVRGRDRNVTRVGQIPPRTTLGPKIFVDLSPRTAYSIKKIPPGPTPPPPPKNHLKMK